MTSIFHSKAHQEAHTIISHLKTTITVLLTSNTIITVKTQILDILINVTRYANIARRRTTLRLSAIASNHKQTILLVTTKQILSIKSCLLQYAIFQLLKYRVQMKMTLRCILQHINSLTMTLVVLCWLEMYHLVQNLQMTTTRMMLITIFRSLPDNQ